MIPAEFLDELVARSDLVDVVSDYVRLTPKGGSYWGLCPFHNEKTPSFSVSPDKRFVITQKKLRRSAFSAAYFIDVFRLIRIHKKAVNFGKIVIYTRRNPTYNVL